MKARFRANDARDILEIIEDLSRAPTGDELMHSFLRHLERIIPSISASFNWFAHGRLDFLVHPPFPPEDIPRFERVMIKNWQQNPLVAHFRATEDARALRWSDLADQTEWYRSPLYREFYLPLGIKDQLGLRMPSPLGVAAALVVNGAHPFDDRDAAVLSRLGHSVFEQLRAFDDREALRGALHGLGWSTLTVNDDGGVIGDTSEDSAKAILARKFVPPRLLFQRAGESSDSVGMSASLTDAGLSRREIDVAILMRNGASNAEIARQLGIAIGTVKKHLERVFRALAVGNRTAAADALRRLIESNSSELQVQYAPDHDLAE